MIVVAPFSNDVLRDWPRGYFRDFVSSLLDHYHYRVTLIGSAEQRQSINLIVRGLAADRVSNVAGTWSWAETMQHLKDAALVVANNSGVAHLGASLGVPTLCIFTASHDPHEWGPRGSRATILYARPNCAPCGMSGIHGCRNGQVCMTELTPELVFAQVRHLLPQTTPPSTATYRGKNNGLAISGRPGSDSGGGV